MPFDSLVKNILLYVAVLIVLSFLFRGLKPKKAPRREKFIQDNAQNSVDDEKKLSNE
jgi:hypothetical protein